MANNGTGLKVIEGVQLEWLVKRKQVLVAWQEEGVEKYLGQLSPHNRRAELSLWIGRDGNHLLVSFHLPIALRASSSKKPRDMYLVVPARALRIGEQDARFSAVRSNDLRATIRTQLQAAPLAGCSRLLHIRFTLSEPSYVVMPKQEYQGTVKGTPFKLLSDFKSLSDAQSFDAYINFNTYAQLGLEQICNSLYDGAFVTPKLDLKRMYGRGAGLNLWEQQGLRKACDDECREVSVPPPPPYEHIASREASDHLCDREASERAPEEIYECIATVKTSANSSPPLPTRQENCDGGHQSAGHAHDRMHKSPYENIDRDSPGDSPTSRHLAKKSAEIAASLDGSPCYISQRHSLDRERTSHERQVSLSSDSISLVAETVLSPLDGDLQVETIAAQRLKNIPVDTASRKRKATSIPSTSVHVGQSVAVSTVHDDKRTRQVTRTSNDLLSEAIHWLFAAWSILPDAHFVLRDEIVALGTAAGKEDMPAFDATRALCSTRLVLYVADRSMSPQRAAAMQAHAEDAVLEVVQWINAVDREADVVVQDHLVNLAQAAKVLDKSVSKGQSEAQRSFDLRKASCIMRACYFAGRRTVLDMIK